MSTHVIRTTLVATSPCPCVLGKSLQKAILSFICPLNDVFRIADFFSEAHVFGSGRYVSCQLSQMVEFMFERADGILTYESCLRLCAAVWRCIHHGR